MKFLLIVAAILFALVVLVSIIGDWQDRKNRR